MMIFLLKMCVDKMKDERGKKKGYHVAVGGLEYDRIIGPMMGKYPVKRLFLLKGDTRDEYPDADELTDEFVKKLENMPIDIEMVEVDIYDFDDVFSATLDVIERCTEDVKDEDSEEETPIYLNVSSAPKLAMIAMISAGFLAGRKANIEMFYVSPEEYLVPQLVAKGQDVGEREEALEEFMEVRDHFMESGSGKKVKDYSEIPVFPLKEVTELDMDILEVLHEEDGAESIGALTEKVNERREEEDKIKRSNVQYRLNKINKMGLVMTERKDRRVEIELTKLGEMYRGEYTGK